ncbi:MAG TPA: hypothetical protein ACN46R_08065, partial [Prochlorococcus sp.]
NLPTDMGRRLLIKNPRCETTVSDSRTTLEYPRQDIVPLTSWRYVARQKGRQSGASFPEASPVYVTFTTASPNRKRVRSEH